MPENRSENHSVLALSKPPLEGWGGHSCWLTPESFRKILAIGLVNPTSVANILCKISCSENEEQKRNAKETLKLLKLNLQKECTSFKTKPVNLDETLEKFECQND